MISKNTLYRKYRPKSLEDILGNDKLVSALERYLQDPETCPHAFLLHGPTGCGKTTIGRIIGERLGCKGSDLREIDTGDFRGIDTSREIRKQISFQPLEGDVKVWILDECHQLTTDAQDAMLKILEETPSHVFFILCTTNPEKLKKTVRDRCTQFQVNLLPDPVMGKLLRSVVKQEGENLQKLVYEQIIQDSLGYPRNALQILDQVLRVDPDLRLGTAQKAAEETSKSIELCRALLDAKGWKEIGLILSGLKEQDPEGIRRHVLAYCTTVVLKGKNNQAALIMETFQEPLYNIGYPGLVLYCYTVINGESYDG